MLCIGVCLGHSFISSLLTRHLFHVDFYSRRAVVPLVVPGGGEDVFSAIDT